MTSSKSTLSIQFIAAGLLLAIVVMMSLTVFPPLRTADAAAWVQAFGAIAGMGLAVFLMYQQSAHADRATIKAIGRRLDAIAAIVDRGCWAAAVLEKHIDPIGNWHDWFYATVNIEDIDSILAALTAIPLHEQDSYEIVVGIHELTVGLQRIRPIAAAHQTSDVHFVLEGDERAAVVYYCRKIREAKERVTKGIASLGHESSPARSPVIY